MSSTNGFNSDLLERVEYVIKDRSSEETEEIYSRWVETYEEDTSKLGYEAPYQTAKYFCDLNIPKSHRILDIGAGTGLVGSLLKQNGYENIDALDGCKEMLERAKKKGIYQNYYETLLRTDQNSCIQENSYDALIMAGVLCPGHLTSDIFPEFLRITKHGGLICWGMRAPSKFVHSSDEYSNGTFEKKVQRLCDEGKWEKLIEPKIMDNFFNGHEGIFYAMKVCK